MSRQANAVTEDVSLSHLRSKPTRDDALPGGKLLAWAGAGVSAAANFIVLGYLAIYCTDTLGLSPAIVGVLIFVSALCNGVGGLIAAFIVDRSPETRWGKARPYEFAVIGTWLFTWILFSTPAGLPEAGRIAWVFVAFLAINVIFDTLLRANDTLYLARAFSGRRVYAKVTTRSGIVTTIGSIILSIALPMLLNAAGKSPVGWSVAIGVVALPLALIGMSRFLFVKERYTTSDTGAPPVKIRDIARALRTNKWIIALACMQLFAAAITGSNVAAYYFRYIVGNLGLQGFLSLFGILILPSVLLLPVLMKRLAISQIIMFGAVSGIIGSVIFAFAGGNLVVLVIGSIFSGLALLPISYLIGVLILDLCTYNESLGNRRLESTLGAIVGIFQKVGQGAAGAFVGFILASAGYDGTADTQSDGAMIAINSLYSWFPASLFAIIFITMLIYMRFERNILPHAQEVVDERRRSLSEETVDSEVDLIPTAVPMTGGPIQIDATAQIEADESMRTDQERDRDD